MPTRRTGLRLTQNGVAVPLDDVPALAPAAFRRECVDVCRAGGRLVALVALAAAEDGLLAVLADDARSALALVKTRPEGGVYPALSDELPQAQAFEREIFETRGIRPQGHPWLKPLRRHEDLEAPGGAAHPFFQVAGSGVHEVAVGPVHAGIIEPGHFRFQCHGESVLHLEIQLGYQHRGAEALLLRSAPVRRLAVAESIAGDAVVGHGWAHCAAIEGLAGVEPPLAAQSLRGIALELERSANHVGDLGALANDVGYLPGASWFGRLRGDLLNLSMDLSGNRYGRGLLVAGGVRFPLSADQRERFADALGRTERELRVTADLMFDTPSVQSRFESTAFVAKQIARELGLVGPVARASGVDVDVRRDHPSGLYRFAYLPVAVAEGGDVMDRARVRWIEVQRSLAFLREELRRRGGGALSVELPKLAPRRLVVSLIEGWRGQIAHVATTGGDGSLNFYKIVDPSFVNWFGLAHAMRENQISDFPLANKSFNLSYAGHDL